MTISSQMVQINSHNEISPHNESGEEKIMTQMKRIIAALMTTAALVVAGGSALAQDGAKIFVVGGKADDPFFAVIKKGVDDAARIVKAYGGSVSFLQLQTYDQIGPDTANLVRTAI